MRTLFACFFVAAAASCGKREAPPPPAFQASLVVEARPNLPIPGAVVQRNNQEIAKTDSTGRVVLTFHGEEGDQVDVWVKCPDGFESPSKPVTVALHHVAGPQKVAEYPVKCPPAECEVVVALVADNGPNLPVKYLNREVARTDAAGATTFMLEAKPGDRMEFLLDTSAKENESLRPQNPTVSLVVDSKDAYYALDQAFQLQKRHVAGATHRTGPAPGRY